MDDTVDTTDTMAEEDEGDLCLNLRAWRQRRGWTQTELARRAGIGRDTVQRIESQRHGQGRWRAPWHRTVLALAHALGIEHWQIDEGYFDPVEIGPEEFPPNDPVPEVPPWQVAPLSDWMMANGLNASKLEHQSGTLTTYTVKRRSGNGTYKQRTWRSGVRWGLVRRIVEGASARPTRVEIGRMCRRLGVQPGHVAEFRALPPHLWAPITLDPDDALPYSSWPAQARVMPS